MPITLHFRSKENEAMKTLTIAALTLAMITAASAQTRPRSAMPPAGPLARSRLTSTAPRHSVMVRAVPPVPLPVTVTAPRRCVMRGAAPPARPQRQDAERRSRMSRTSTLSGSSRSSMEERDRCGGMGRLRPFSGASRCASAKRWRAIPVLSRILSHESGSTMRSCNAMRFYFP